VGWSTVLQPIEFVSDRGEVREAQKLEHHARTHQGLQGHLWVW
jgi:hypothetical protein